MIISFFEVTDMEKEEFDKVFNKHNTARFFSEPLQNVDIKEYEDSDAICVFVHSKVSKETIKACPNLKMIATRSTGTDHIDVAYAEEKNIAVKNVPLYGENTVAEHTFALMLSLSRKINESYISTCNGNFSTDGLMGFDLKNKTIGIIGGGRIGLHVARMARSFGMHVRVYDIKQDEFLAEIINFKYVSLDELLETSDIVTLHVPSNKYTHHMINDETLSKMKDGSILINTARGDLVKTNDLIKHIESGKIYGAGLDVLEGENLMIEENMFNSPIKEASKAIELNKKLTELPNVVITPHNAFNSIEAVQRIIAKTISNIDELVVNN